MARGFHPSVFYRTIKLDFIVRKEDFIGLKVDQLNQLKSLKHTFRRLNILYESKGCQVEEMWIKTIKYSSYKGMRGYHGHILVAAVIMQENKYPNFQFTLRIR